MALKPRAFAFAIALALGAGCGDAAPELLPPDSGANPQPLLLEVSTDDHTDPPACEVLETSLSVSDDWHQTGIEVSELVPDGWDPWAHPTLLFSHGNDLSPESYACYRLLLGQRCIRTVMPRLWNTDDGDLPHLGWEARQLRWEDTCEIYDVLSQEQELELIFIGGHSMGAYGALLAAGADSAIGDDQAGNCEVEGDETECEPLEAAGFVVLSGWPAQRAEADPPFWFAEHAFADLLPNRFVAYGELDSSSGDPCLIQEPPICRADAYLIDSSDAAVLNLRHVMVPGFEHLDLACEPEWEQSHIDPDAVEQLVDELGQWIWNTVGAAEQSETD